MAFAIHRWLFDFLWAKSRDRDNRNPDGAPERRRVCAGLRGSIFKLSAIRPLGAELHCFLHPLMHPAGAMQPLREKSADYR